MMPRVDAGLEPLLEDVESISEEISRLMAALPFLGSMQKREATLRRIRDLAISIEISTARWADQQLEESLDEFDAIYLFALGALDGGLIPRLVQQSRSEILQTARQSASMIVSDARRLASPVLSQATLRDLLGSRAPRDIRGLSDKNRTEITQSLQKKLRNRLVRVVGKDGKLYRFSADYWVSLRSFMSRQSALTQLTVQKSLGAGEDLVQISANPSTIGDFCDLYRGKVYSISGTSLTYPPLDVVPNGGPPMHPWCKHLLLPFSGDADFDGIPEEFVELSRNPDAGASEFQKLWLSGRED